MKNDTSLNLEEIKKFGIINQLKESTKGKIHRIVNNLNHIITIMNDCSREKFSNTDYHINLNNAENDLNDVKILIDEIKKYE